MGAVLVTGVLIATGALIATGVLFAISPTASALGPGGVEHASRGKFTVSTNKPFDALMKEAMALMHRGMASAKPTGDPDIDFCSVMVPHHEGAVNMARVLLLYGRDKAVRNFAQKIIANQTNEIRLMERLLKKYDEASLTSAEFATASATMSADVSEKRQADIEAAGRKAMASMMAAMEKSPMTGEPDKDFVTLMIPHHEGAVVMAEAARPLIKNPAMKSLAEEIITEQRYEIQFMESWLGRLASDEDREEKPNPEKSPEGLREKQP